jgi:hypothetical protein
MTQLVGEPGLSYRLPQRFPGREPSRLVNDVANSEACARGR